MNNFSALGALKRRWWVIIILAVVGAGLGALPKPAKVAKQSQFTQYQATETLLVNDQSDVQNGGSATAISPNQVPLFATTGEVPELVKTKIGYQGNAAELASQVTVQFDLSTGALTVETTQDTAAQAELVVNTFGDELNGYLAEHQDEIYQQRLAASLDRLSKLEAQVKDLTSKLKDSPTDAVLLAQQDAVSRQYSVAFEQNQVLQEQPPILAFTVLQKAQAVSITKGGGGLSAPTSRSTRGALGGFVGAVLGFGVIMLLGVLDRRIRSREQAEEILGMRARVLIPKVKSIRRALVVDKDHHDALSDSYRTLRNVIGFVQGSLPPVERARVTVVVSPGPGEGKTSLAANLAAAIVETGQHTVAINTDFRRPQLAGVVVDGQPPILPFLLGDLDTIEPKWLLSETGTPNLSLLDLSTIDGSAGELARATAHLLPRVAGQSDAIVVDTSPVGATAEVLELVPLADVIVLITKVGQTAIQTAERTIAILRDVSTAPIILVLTGLKPDRDPYYEYADRRAVEPKQAPKQEVSSSAKPKGRRRADPPTRRKTDASPDRSSEPVDEPTHEPAAQDPTPIARERPIEVLDDDDAATPGSEPSETMT